MDLMYRPPGLRTKPEGRVVRFDLLCARAGMRMVVSASNLPDVRLHRGETDFKAVSPGRVVYCIAARPIFRSPEGLARVVMDKLAYQFHDWAAREVVSAHRRSRGRIVSDSSDSLTGIGRQPSR